MLEIELKYIQRKKWQEVDPANIPTGAKVADELLFKYLPFQDSSLVIFGGGNGRRARGLGERYDQVTSIDINTLAVQEAWKHPSPLVLDLVGDVTHLIPEEFPLALRACLHQTDCVLVEGLLCNLMGSDAQAVFFWANNFLNPEGYLVIADLLSMDEINPALANLFSDADYSQLRKGWADRYAVNTQVGLPYHTFLVTPPGDEGEWGNFQTLLDRFKSKKFERFARHYSETEIRNLLNQCGFVIRHFEKTVWLSRQNHPLSGFIAVAAKSDTQSPLAEYVADGQES